MRPYRRAHGQVRTESQVEPDARESWSRNGERTLEGAHLVGCSGPSLVRSFEDTNCPLGQSHFAILVSPSPLTKALTWREKYATF